MTEDGHDEKIKSLLSKVINMTKALIIVAISLCPKTKKRSFASTPLFPLNEKKEGNSEILRYF